MQVTFVKIRDPIAWRTPDLDIYDEELRLCVPVVVCHAGVLITEDENRLVIGEVVDAKDNPEQDEIGMKLPKYRAVTIIAKESIMYRQDWTVTEK